MPLEESQISQDRRIQLPVESGELSGISGWRHKELWHNGHRHKGIGNVKNKRFFGLTRAPARINSCDSSYDMGLRFEYKCSVPAARVDSTQP
jgi:hypothetical protein